jgi:predicted nuclease with TOPRIM domain
MLPASGGDTRFLVEKLRGQIGTVWPTERMKLGMDHELREKQLVAEGLKKLTIKLGTKVCLALRAIGEAKMDDMPSNV